MEEPDIEQIEQEAVVTPKTVDVYTPLFVILKNIHIRLIAEGYVIKDGQITKSERMLEIDRNITSPRKRSRRPRKS